MLLLIEQCSEKYAKKLIGRTDIEDALKRLDKLTNEEAWMGIALNLKATHTLGDCVRGVMDKVMVIDNKVAGVDDRVASIVNTVKGVDAMVASVDDRVRVVDDRVVEAIRGAYIIFNRSPKPYLYLIHSDGKEVKAATQQTATDVDQIKRLSSNLARVQTTEPYAYFQGTNCGKTFINGSPHQIPR